MEAMLRVRARAEAAPVLSELKEVEDVSGARSFCLDPKVVPARSTENDSDCTVPEVGPAIESDSFFAVSELCATSPGNFRAGRLPASRLRLMRWLPRAARLLRLRSLLLFLLGDSGVLVLLMKLVLD